MATLKVNTMQKCLENLSLISDIWILAIIMKLEEKSFTFNGLKRGIPGISPATLTNRLKKMVAEELISKSPSSTHKQGVIYELAPRGKLLLPVVESMKKAALQL